MTTLIAYNDSFIFERKRVQRRKGGCRNMYVISLKSFSVASSERAEIRKTIKTLKGTFIHSMYWSASFRKREDAEKAWVYLALKW